MTSFHPQVRVHQTQPAVYLHINPICGASKYATEEQLANAAIWRKC